MISSDAPEDRELAQKREELARLREVLSEKELTFTTLQTTLHEFERRYLATVGVLYATLDEIEADVAEAEARKAPQDANSQQTAERLRQQARESREAASHAEAELPVPEPSPELKTLFRQVAKACHPDLTTDREERDLRTKVMAEANEAYRRGDVAKLRDILDRWQSRPESVKGEGVGAELVRVIREISQVENRIAELHALIAKAMASPLHDLMLQVRQAESQGRDFLKEMSGMVEGRIQVVQERRNEGRQP